MQRHSETLTLPYTPEQCFALVADVARYPEFLPWCKAARILSASPTAMTAELVIAFHSLRESYTSSITLTPHTRIQVQQLKGPFSTLNTTWEFTPTDNGTQLTFCLEFAFRSKILEALIGKLYFKAVEKMTHAFVTRAHALYG